MDYRKPKRYNEEKHREYPGLVESELFQKKLYEIELNAQVWTKSDTFCFWTIAMRLERFSGLGDGKLQCRY